MEISVTFVFHLEAENLGLLLELKVLEGIGMSGTLRGIVLS